MNDDNLRREAALALALGLVYLALMPGHFQSVDGLLVFEQARSLWHDGSFRFAEPIIWEIPYSTSLYGLGGSLAHLPGVALFSALEPTVYVPGSGAQEWGRLYQDPVYALGGNPVPAVATALTAFGVARLGSLLGLAPGLRLAAMLLFGLASPAFIYAGADFTQPLVTALITWAMVHALRSGLEGGTGPLVACAVLVFFAVLTRPLEGVLAVPFLLLAANPGFDLGHSVRSLLILGSGAALAGAASLAVNAARFGSAFHNEYAELGARFVLSWEGPLGLLVSPAWGLLFAFPAICLVPLGLRSVAPDRLDALRAWSLLGFAVSLWCVIGAWHMWWGGIAWGPRLLLPAFPFLAVLAARGMDRLEPEAARRIGVGVFVIGLLYALPGVLVDLHGGYGALIAEPSRGWWTIAHPTLGGWRGLERIFADTPLDRHALDIHWFRIARSTGWLSLMVPAVLLTAAGLFAARALRRSAMDTQDEPAR